MQVVWLCFCFGRLLKYIIAVIKEQEKRFILDQVDD